VNDSNAQTEALGEGGRSFGLARVSGYDHRIPVVRYLRLDVVDQKGRCSQVVHGHVEEALDLFGLSSVSYFSWSGEMWTSQGAAQLSYSLYVSLQD